MNTREIRSDRRRGAGARGRAALWTEAGALVAASSSAYLAASYAAAVARPAVYHRGGPRVRSLLARVPGLQRTFWPSPHLLQRDVAMAVSIKLREQGKPRVKFGRESVQHADGGDSALDWLAEPADSEPAESSGIGPRDAPDAPLPLRPDSPVLLILHSITATLEGRYGLSPLLLESRLRGWRTAVHVRRGCVRWNPLGCARDLKDAIDAVREKHPDSPIALVGISAGSAVLQRYLGEFNAHADSLRVDSGGKAGGGGGERSRHAGGGVGGGSGGAGGGGGLGGRIVGAVAIAPGYRMPHGEIAALRTPHPPNPADLNHNCLN
ncbi:hypothetical protein T492DRAFT_468778 [Pavlovales sp. CCMP2436]|nr:hypothetical protein T492DRAFT_468778 [Pavlovales sp. CCMP2436]